MAEVINLNQPEDVNNNHLINAPKSNLESFLDNEQQQPIPITPKRMEIIDIINDYKFSRFKDRLLSIDETIFDNLIYLNDVELEERKQAIETLVFKYNNSKACLSTCNGVLGLTDKVLCMVGFHVEGASNIIMQNENVLDLLEEMRLKYGPGLYMSPEKRLAWEILSTYITIDRYNTAKLKMKSDENTRLIQAHLEKEIKYKLDEKYTGI